MKKHNSGNKRRSALTVVEITVTSSVVVILGILLLYIASSWYTGAAIEAAEEVGKNIQIIRSALMIENIKYDDDPSGASLIVRNIAKEDLSLRIIAVDLVTVDNKIIGHEPLSDRDYILHRGEKIVLENVPTCGESRCHKGDILRYRVWYIPERYADGQVSALGKAVFVESSFIYTGGELSLACPPPGDYIMIDMVDPVLLTSGEFSGSNTIYIRPAIKPGSSLKINLTVYVERLDGSASGNGSAKNVQVPSSEDVKIVGKFSGIKVPFKIIIKSPDVEIIQQEWIMRGNPGSVFVSGITLLWRETDYMVHTVVVEIGAPELSKDIMIKTPVKILDCSRNKLTEVVAVERVPSGMDVDLPVFIKLPKPVRFDQIYAVEAEIIEIG